MMNINKKEQELVDDVLENFDFKDTHRAMKLLNWKWVHSMGVPSLNEIRNEASKRIESAIECAKESKNQNHHICYYSSSGGFKASVWKNRYGQITNVQLEFILNEWMAGED